MIHGMSLKASGVSNHRSQKKVVRRKRFKHGVWVGGHACGGQRTTSGVPLQRAFTFLLRVSP